MPVPTPPIPNPGTIADGDLSPDEREVLRRIASRGGRATRDRHGKAHFGDLGKRSGEVRRRKAAERAQGGAA